MYSKKKTLILQQIIKVIGCKNKNYLLNYKKMRQKSFTQLYLERKNEPTPAQKFISEVAELTNRSEQTVRMWLSGVQTPDPNVSKVIGMHFNVDPDTLFANA